MADESALVMHHHGISPWELEVAYGIFVRRFSVEQNMLEYEGEEYASILEICIPVAFGDAFFEWFDRREWDKLKFLLKEMKRRRGGRKAIKLVVNFAGAPSVQFIVDAHDRDWYNNAVEKIDFMTELVPHHLGPENIPDGAKEVTYRYDEKTKRWSILGAKVSEYDYVKKNGEWLKVPAPED